MQPKSLFELSYFSPQNLWRMRQFYETYNGGEILSTLSGELNWSMIRD
ncbi:MAG: DUF1016 N-terminal domain-containing protein [Candidatus Methanoplasma sp.]|nr:DUF1016 N-terminal domain-containing protein [Candidatus Methanoplasma sp.]